MEERGEGKEGRGRGFKEVQESNLAVFLSKSSFQDKGLWSVFNLNLHVLCSLLRLLNLRMREDSAVSLGTITEKDEDSFSALIQLLVNFQLRGHH